MGMFEYEAQMSNARSPEDMSFVADAFRAGEKKQQDKIWEKIDQIIDNSNYLNISKDSIRKIIYDNIH